MLYAGLYASLRNEIDTFLEGEVREFMVTVNAHPNDDAEIERDVRAELGSRLQRDLAFRLFDDRGQLLVTSESDDPITKQWKAPNNWYQNQPHTLFQTARLADERVAYRTCSLLVTTNDGRICTAQASYTLDQMDESLADFRDVCALGLVLAAILSVGSGRWLAKRSLYPVKTVTETASRIGASSLSERIPLKGTDDELDRLAGTLNTMLERIEQHVIRVQQFTADASHELRSPLAALRGSAEVALTNPRSVEELRQVLEESIEHYDRLAHIADDLLLLARADDGHEIAHRELVQLDVAVAKVVDLYAPLAQERGINLFLKDRVEISLHGDGARLRQLIGNLLDNAVKFSEAESQIQVSLAMTDGVARITVADTGVGIEAENLPCVFDRFYREDQARSTKRSGAGLGLPICHAIVDAHGGNISINSTPGDGTIVTVELPLNGSKRYKSEPDIRTTG